MSTEYLIEQLTDANLLTQRQAEVWGYREIEGLSRSQTAEKMDISPYTVDDYLSDARDKIESAQETVEILQAVNDNITMQANEQKHRADEVETVIVDIDDLLELMRWNERDKNEEHSHRFKLSPPFKGEKKLTTVVEEGRYPPEMDPKPVHISPRSILTETTGRGEWNPEWSHPDYGVQRGDFKDAVGEVEKNEDDWEEWWERAVELWEHEVRSRLKEVDELTLHTADPDIEDTTMNVRFESEE